MGVGIYLAGRYEPGGVSVELWLQRVGDWFEDNLAGDPVWGNLLTKTDQGECSDGNPALFVNFFPANEPAEFFVPQPGRMIVSAKTSILGPGYHIALCQILKQLGDDLGIAWEPHIYGHGVTEAEVEYVLRHPGEDLPGRDDSRQALGQTEAGRYLRVIYVPDDEGEGLFVVTAYELRGKPLQAYRRRRRR